MRLSHLLFNTALSTALYNGAQNIINPALRNNAAAPFSDQSSSINTSCGARPMLTRTDSGKLITNTLFDIDNGPFSNPYQIGYAPLESITTAAPPKPPQAEGSGPNAGEGLKQPTDTQHLKNTQKLTTPTTEEDQDKDNVYPSVHLKICVYQGRSWHSAGQAFLKLEREGQEPIAIGLSPKKGKPQEWTRTHQTKLKDCQDYLNKNNVKFIDIPLNNEQTQDLLRQMHADCRSLNENFQCADLQNSSGASVLQKIEKIAEGFDIEPDYTKTTPGIEKNFKQCNSVKYIDNLMKSANIDVKIPSGLHTPKNLWRYLNAEGHGTLETTGGLPVAQSMTLMEFLGAHLSGRSRKVPAEMARQSMEIMRQIREDLQKTFIDPEPTRLDIDPDLLNRAAGFLDRFAQHLDELAEITAYGYQKMLGHPDNRFQRPIKRININPDGDPKDVKVYLCSYPSRSLHREGQAFLSFETGGRQRFAIALAPDTTTDAGTPKSWSGVGNRLGLSNPAKIIDASHHLGKKGVKKLPLNLNQQQIQELMATINADAKKTNSPIRLSNIGGLKPSREQIVSLKECDYRSTCASRLTRQPRNNSVDYLSALMNRIYPDKLSINKVFSGSKTPRTLAKRLQNTICNMQQKTATHPHLAEIDLYDPQSLTLSEGVAALFYGLRKSVPNMMDNVKEDLNELANHIGTLVSDIGLVENDFGLTLEERKAGSLPVKLAANIAEAYNTTAAAANITPGFRQYAKNNIETIDQILLSLSRTFQTLGGHTEPLTPKSPTTRSEGDNRDRKLRKLLFGHRTMVPSLISASITDHLALTQSIRTQLVEPLKHFNQTVGQGESSYSTLLNSLRYDTRATYSTTHHMRREMAKGAREAKNYLHNIAATIGEFV